MSASGASATPLMQQYRDIKARHQHAILFFRMGDFYEMFYEDAEVASRVLGLTLTSRNNGGAAEVPLAGVPVKAMADYLRRLVQQGYRVAVCEQVEDPKLARGIVRREVVETITPGAAFDDDVLGGTRANYVCAISIDSPGTSSAASSATSSRSSSSTSSSTSQSRSLSTSLSTSLPVGIAAADLSTGEFRLFATSFDDAPAVLARLAPKELLIAQQAAPQVALQEVLRSAERALQTLREAWEFDSQLAAEDIARHYAVQSLEGFGFAPGDRAAVGAAGALLRYLRELQPGGLPHLARPVIERSGRIMPLDEMTRRNLELVESLRADSSTDSTRSQQGTLLSVLDRTVTPMGNRLLRQWILAPLLNINEIEARLDSVTVLVRDAVGSEELRDALDGVRDVERLASKAAAGRATPRELRAFGDSLERLPSVSKTLSSMLASAHAVGAASQANQAQHTSAGVLNEIINTWDNGEDCAAHLTSSLVARPPIAIGEEDTIAAGVDAALDELRALRDGGRDAIAAIQQQERTRTGIASLKVGYNKVFGYFIEISNANKHLVPADYQRRQTLTGAERYITPALKEYEEKVLTAAERIEQRERELFEQMRLQVGKEIARWQGVAQRVAVLDVLAAFADTSRREQYVRPILHDGFHLNIRAGRHPVVERMMPREKFIPNDVDLTDDAHLVVLTGPNMAGKSTVLRQIGLIQLMAQIGIYVPASEAVLPVVDRVFTRVGASDNLVRGQSTFMVEMSETSAILHTATRRSLVLLDEIGRGTSTYDGVSIAWSVSEHLHDAIGCKTVFATHYHELTQLESELSGVRNFTIAVREVGDQVLFLHKLIPGGADRSYGIEVGRLAGLPAPVIARAKEVLALLEGEGEQMAARLTAEGMQVPVSTMRRGPRLKHQMSQAHPDQLGFFAETSAVVEAKVDPALTRLADAVQALDPEQMTPLQALTTLASLKDSMAQAKRELHERSTGETT